MKYRDLNSQQYLRLLVTILISIITTAILIYPERFLMGSYPFSYLGRHTTPLGTRNIFSRLVFDLGMVLCSYTMVLMVRYFQKARPVPESHIYQFLSSLSALGFIMMVVPCDVQEVRFIHSFGSGFVVGSHLFMATIRVVAVQHHLKPWITVILLTTLIISVLLYAGLWFMNHPSNPLFQKPAFAAIIYVELYGSHLSRDLGEQKVLRVAHSHHH